jgi:hypothetical protein
VSVFVLELSYRSTVTRSARTGIGGVGRIVFDGAAGSGGSDTAFKASFRFTIAHSADVYAIEK